MRRALAAVSAVAGLLLVATPHLAGAQARTPYSGLQVLETGFAYQTLVDRLLRAIEKHGMNVLARVSATAGAARIGVEIPGNAVIMVFRPDYAVRMLRASVPAGIEAPLRFYVSEGADGQATLTYRRPSSVFAPYGSPALDAMAHELDRIFADIVRDALAP